jgi:hypothetical protein
MVVDLLSQSGECGIVEEVFDPFEKVCTALFQKGCDSLIQSSAYQAEEQVYESDPQGYFQYTGTEHVNLRGRANTRNSWVQSSRIMLIR